MAISITAQIAEVERELDQRAKVYPRMVSTNKLRQSVADLHVVHMQAVLTTLRWLQTNEVAIKAALKPASPQPAAGGSEGS